MIEICFHGRGGQGVVVASEILAEAFFREGKFVQTFPEFGVERRGAPVRAYLRVDHKPLRLRCRIYQPDGIIILDPVLLSSVNVTDGLKSGGWILINSSNPASTLGYSPAFQVAWVDATRIALKYNLGPRTAPIINTAILGSVARLPGMVRFSSIKKAIAKRIKKGTSQNIAAAREAYEETKFHL